MSDETAAFEHAHSFVVVNTAHILMARVPISFYLNILAGIIVLFNHYVASETGDIALNKITGAADRFYTLFRDTVLTFQHGCTSRLETVLCGTPLDSLLPRDAIAYLKVHYCHSSAQGLERVGGTSSDRQSHGGYYGGSDSAFVHYQPATRPGLGKSPSSLCRSTQNRLSQAVWHRSGEAMAMIGTLLLRTCVSQWWFRAPVTMTGILLATSSALLILGHVFGAGIVMRCVSQVYMVAVADFLRCIEWEAQRQVLVMGVVTMERAYALVGYACKTQIPKEYL